MKRIFLIIEEWDKRIDREKDFLFLLEDQMMGLAIAHEIRNQVVFISEPLTPYPEFKGWEDETTYKEDYGEQLVIV